MKNLTVMILAGGKSTRMGHDKAQLCFGEKTLLDLQIDKAIQLMGDPSRVWVSGRLSKVNSVLDNYSSMGPLGGLESVVRKLLDRYDSKSTHNIEWLLLYPVDMPLLEVSVLNFLWQQLQNNIESHQDLESIHYKDFELPVIFKLDKKLLTRVEDILLSNKSSQRSLHTLLDQLNDIAVPYEDSYKNYFMNINTPEDWRKYYELKVV